MTLTSEQIKFLKSVEKELKAKDFDEIYWQASNRYADACGLTRIFMAADIDPLPYMSSIPNDYMYDYTENGMFAIEVPQNIKEIGASAFRESALTNIYLHDGIVRIGSECFMGSMLRSIKIPTSIETISRLCFKDCTMLTEVDIPANVMMIRRRAFEGCTRLSDVTLHEGLEDIRDFAFTDCPSLKKIYIPESVYRISTDAFDRERITISGKKGSSAELYAQQRNIPFIEVP